MKTIFVIFCCVATVACLDGPAISKLKKIFNESALSVGDRVSCDVNITLQDGCLLRATLEDCVILPTLRMLQSYLFPQLDLSKVTGNFVNVIKLRVSKFSLNACDSINVYYKLFVNSFESYDLAEGYLTVTQLNMTLTFSALEGFVNNLGDVTVEEGKANVIIGGNNATITLESPKLKRTISYKISIDVVPLVDILKSFQIGTLEETFGKEISTERRLSQLQFIDAKIVGYSAPNVAFEFQISGEVNNIDIFQNSPKVYLILQKYLHELKDVKCLIFILLENNKINNLLHVNADIDLPILEPYDGKFAFSIANDNFMVFNNEEIQHETKRYDVEGTHGDIIHKGAYFLYRLKRDSADDTTVLAEDVNQTKLENNTLLNSNLTLPTVNLSSLNRTYVTDETIGKNQSANGNNTQMQQNDLTVQTAEPIDGHEREYLYQQQQNYHQSNSKQFETPQFLASKWFNNEKFRQEQRGNLYYPNQYYYVRYKRDENSRNQTQPLEIHTNPNLSSRPSSLLDEQDKDSDFLVFQMKVVKHSSIITPKQDLSGSFKDVLSYVMGDQLSNGKESIPLDDDIDYKLLKVVVSKKDRSTKIKTVFRPSAEIVILPTVLKANLDFTIIRLIGQNDSWFGKWSIGKDNSDETLQNETNVKVIFDEEYGKYYLTDELEMYCQEELSNKTVLSSLSKEYKQTFPELSRFPFKNATFQMELKQNAAEYVRIQGTSLMFDSREVYFENLIWKTKRLVGMTTGISIKDIALNDFLEELYGKKMLQTCWLTMKNLAIVFSSKRNHTLERFLEGKMDGVVTPKDDSIFLRGELSVNLKTGCLDEPICNFIKNHITHDLHLSIEGAIYYNMYTLVTKLQGVSISFGNVWGMNEIELIISGTSEKNSGVSITGNFIHKETKQVGKYRALQRKTFEIIFENPWKSFMGFTMVTVKNMVAEIDISTDEVIKELNFDASIEIGNSLKPLLVENGKVVLSTMKSTSTKNDVCYGKLKDLSISQFNNAFLKSKIHPLLQKSTFDNVYFCFTKNEKGYVVEDFGSFTFTPLFNGAGSFTSFVGNVAPRLRLNENVQLRFKSKKLNYNDEKLVLQADTKNSKSGPEFLFQFTDSDGKEAVAGAGMMLGYLKTLGYQSSIVTQLRDTRFEHSFEGYLYDEVKMSVSITGRLNQNMNDTKIITKLDSKKASREIRKELKTYIDSKINYVNEELIKKSEKLTSEIVHTVGEMKNKLLTLKSDIESKRSEIFKKRLTMEMSNEIIKKDCTENCGKECITALDWDRDCSTVREQKFGCLKWKKCQTKAANVKCIAKCEAKKIPATTTACENRDDIRDLVRDMLTARHLSNAKHSFIKEGNQLYEESMLREKYLRKRFDFVTSITTDRKDLFTFTDIIPTSIQKLINVKIPCIRYDVIHYKFLDRPYTVVNKELCLNGRFFKDFSRAVINNIAKEFSTITVLIDQSEVDIIKTENKLKIFREKYEKKLEDEKLENEDKEMLYDITDEQDENYDRGFQVSSALLNSRADELENSSMLHASKRDTIQKENPDKDIVDATETDIHPYDIKNWKTEAAFESDAPWVYMNKKRGLTIPALGVLMLRNTSVDDHCAQRLDAIEHFEDLSTSLSDIKRAYDEGLASLEKEKVRLSNDENEIDEEIRDGDSNISIENEYSYDMSKTIIASKYERADMMYWLQKYKQGITEYLDSAIKQLDHQNKVGLKYWKTQLNSAIRTSIAQTPTKYFEKLKSNVLKSKGFVKRSKIDGEEALEAITKA